MNVLLDYIRAISSHSNLFNVGFLGFAYRQAAGGCQRLAVFVLGRAVASADRFRTQMEVFGFSAADSLAPGFKRARVQMRSHDLND